MPFAVEVYQPNGIAPELRASFEDFEEAISWLRARRAEDTTRLPRLFGYTDGEQHGKLAGMGMHPL